MKTAGVIFPHQLFEENPLLSSCSKVWLVEEHLFFKHYSFHKQKILFHRASMKFYEYFLQSNGINPVYIDSFSEFSDIRILVGKLKEEGFQKIEYIDPADDWLESRLIDAAETQKISVYKHLSPLFLNAPEDLIRYFSGKKKFYQTDFYKNQRISRGILVDESLKPEGGKWTFDAENRLKYPKNKIPPAVTTVEVDPFLTEAKEYTLKYFGNHYGTIHLGFLYPVDFEGSKKWFSIFLSERFAEFGDYEDAIVASEHILHHSVITPMLNVGLITPNFVINESLRFAKNNNISINSSEGFLRQILGWREFIRAVYILKGKEQRSHNFWRFQRKIPSSFWTGDTGIVPIDNTIRKVLNTGYCHHIERLMILGNFMLLCEFDPNEVYRWFMEMFIDSYDWVMVPNVYGMSQFADGGLMSSKPYISGSNYILKMSDYSKGKWSEIWDVLFWRFLNVHRDFFYKNPRLNMLVKTFDKMPESKQKSIMEKAEYFLNTLS
jgi:deoxyribodipyrimidine photolyase-related protein